MSAIKTCPGVAERFIAEVERRCKTIGLTPHILCVMARLSYPTWGSWTDPNEPSSPTASSMDAVLSELDRQEKMRGGKK